MSKKLPKTSAKAAHAEVLQHFLPTQLLPDEDPETHAALRDAILLDLTPGTPYERILAEQLVTLEWEALRHRRMRDSLLLAEYRDQSMGVFKEGEVGRVYSFQQTNLLTSLTHRDRGKGVYGTGKRSPAARAPHRGN